MKKIYHAWRQDPYRFHVTFEIVHGISSAVLIGVLVFDLGAYRHHRSLRKLA